MGLLSALKLPPPPGSTRPPDASSTPPDAPTPEAGPVTPDAPLTGGLGDAVRKAGKMSQEAAKGTPPAPPKKDGMLGGVSDMMLTVRVQMADQQMNAALAAANSVGNPLNNRTAATPEAPARKVWQSGMVQYWQPGSAARQQALSLQGEPRIAKAQEATALLAQARAVFQQGLQSLT
jgi:hypothetical protein